MALTTKDIVDHIQNGLGYQRNKSVEITESLIEIITSNLESGEDVLVRCGKR